ncbi:YqaJ viral recombinase family protein [Lysobacter sp. Root96]|uniref:YqaJ viral recombinase family protein n=1 Tax=Lysobacter sp. Root96 TaxID=1736612 RepID=UPI0006F230F0|nr:YqaJ viral recombinase family protein [Lysobacter sp. Root96]KRD71401.1 hypothetical protein ASE45_06215 [Lysobacter sp. Root96]
MKTLNLIQGTPEWAAHRATHWNASDAPAMLGVSAYKTRAQLLREIATGVAAEVDEATQWRFDQGHRFEALARPLAEQILGEDLFPCVGVSDDGLFSASFDGLTLAGDTAFEHKSLNEDLRAAMFEGSTGRDLPMAYQVQMEQQCLVSGAERVLFMASSWDGDSLADERHCWYSPNTELRRRLVAAWAQFEVDIAGFTPVPAAAPPAVGKAPDSLPALRIELTGMVTESNLQAFRDRAIEVFQGISTELTTDQDFATADQTGKWCKEIEDKLEAAKQHALSQTQSIDELFRAIDAIKAEARAKRLELEKLVTRRKEEVRGEIVQRGFNAVAAHYQQINASLGEHALQLPHTLRGALAQAIKGKRSIDTMNDAVDAAVAGEKIDASETAERVRSNIAILSDDGAGFETLFADRRALVASKTPDDLRNLVKARIAEHQQKLEDDRARIRQEEADRLERQQQQDTPKGDDARAAAEPVMQPGNPAPLKVGAAPTPAGARIKLGDINAWIAPMSITADGMGILGFRPVGKERAAVLYAASDFSAICAAMIRSLQAAPARATEKQAA